MNSWLLEQEQKLLKKYKCTTINEVLERQGALLKKSNAPKEKE